MAQPPTWRSRRPGSGTRQSTRRRAQWSRSHEEGEGIGLDPVRGAWQQQAKQPCLVKLVEQGRRQPARVLDLAGGGRDYWADRLGTRDHVLVARYVGRTGNQRVQGNPR